MQPRIQYDQNHSHSERDVWEQMGRQGAHSYIVKIRREDLGVSCRQHGSLHHGYRPLELSQLSSQARMTCISCWPTPYFQFGERVWVQIHRGEK